MRLPIFFLTCALVGGLNYGAIAVMASVGWLRMPTLTFEVIALAALITFVLYRWLSRIQGGSLFINGYLGSIVIKLLFFAGLLLTLRIIIPLDFRENAILILVAYVTFTILEVVVLFNQTGRQKR